MLNQSKFTCHFCGKGYTRKISHNKHLLLCEIIHKSKREIQCEEEENTDIPTIKQLYQVIQELAFKYSQLEEKMELLEKNIPTTKKKKLHIIETPSITFQKWPHYFTVDPEDIDCLINDGFQAVVLNILKKNLKTGCDPIYYDKETRDFYKYIKTEDKNMEEWTKMGNQDFVPLLQIIHSRILRELTKWRETNKVQLRNNAKLDETYNRCLIKFMSQHFTQDSLLNHVKKTIQDF